MCSKFHKAEVVFSVCRSTGYKQTAVANAAMLLTFFLMSHTYNNYVATSQHYIALYNLSSLRLKRSSVTTVRQVCTHTHTT